MEKYKRYERTIILVLSLTDEGILKQYGFTEDVKTKSRTSLYKKFINKDH